MQRMPQYLKNQMLILLDVVLCIFLCSLFCSVFLLRIMLLAAMARVIPVVVKDKKRKCLRIYQGNLSVAQEKGVMSNFYDDGSFFDHVYVVGFPADKNRIIEYDQSRTFIDIGITAHSLKRANLKLSFASVNLFVFLWKVADLWKMVRKEISMIRGSDPHHTAIAAMILSFITATPYCISIHSDYDLIFPEENFFYMKTLPIKAKFLRKLLEQFAFSRTKFILCISRFITQYALRNGAREDAIRIIPHGVDISLFDKVDRNQIRNRIGCKDKHLIVVISRISREKNILDIPDIAMKFESVEPNFVFVIAGDGPDRKVFEEKIEQLHLREKIRLMGFRSQNTVIALRKAADVNLCLFDGYSLIEAALSARPIVAYDIEWHAELIKDNQTGILVPNRDTKAVALAIKRLIDDLELSNFLGENARKLAAYKHSSEVAVQSKIKIFNEIILSKVDV